MRCAECGSESRAGIRFCEDCGARLAACPGCGAPVRPGKRFCGACGAPLAGPDETAAPAIEPGRASVLAVALDGPAPGPDEVARLCEREGARLLAADARGLLAAHPSSGQGADDLQRAALLALALRRRAGDGRPGASPTMRAGLARGEVRPGPPGGAPLGWGVERARMLCEAARPGEVLVGDADAPALEASVRVRAARVVGLGRSGPAVTAYEVVGVGPRRSPREGLAPRLLSPFVGRDAERGALEEAVSCARGGRGRIVGITGEAGIGKSRLLYEVRRGLPPGGVTYLEGRCLPYGRAVPLLPMLDVLRDDCGISAADAPETITAKVRAGLEEVGLDDGEDAPFLLRLLSVPGGADALAGMSAEAVRARTFDVLCRMALAGAARRPLVLALEDLHWVDESTERFLTALLPAIGDRAVLVALTYRPDYDPPWRRLAAFSEIELPALGADAALALVRSATAGVAAPEGVLGEIVARSGGNPLFLEELASSVTVREPERAAVPATLAGAIQGRLDRLPGTQRRLLQVGSVLGRRFPERLLALVAEPPPGWESDLAGLERQGFLVRDGAGNQPAWSFRHALLQEVAHDAVGPGQRRAWHAAAARALESLHAGRLDEVAEQLALHWSRSERAEEAVTWLLRAADGRARGYAHAEAERALEAASVHAEALPPGRREERALDIAVRRARSLYFLGRVPQSMDLLAGEEDRLRARGDRRALAELRFWLAHAHSHVGDPDEATRLARSAAAAGARDPSLTGRARYVLAREAWWTGRLDEGIVAAESAIPLLEEADETFWLAHCLCFMGHCLRDLGRLADAIAAAERAQALGAARDDPRMRSFASWSRGWYLASAGRGDEGLAECERALRLSPDPANSAWTLGFIGHAHMARGDAAAAVAALEESIAEVRRTRHARVLQWFRGWLADALLAAGRTGAAEEAARTALDAAESLGCPWGAAAARRALGRARLRDGHPGDARPLLERAEADLLALGARLEAAVTGLDLAELDRREGACERAEARRAAARRALGEMGVRVRLPGAA